MKLEAPSYTSADTTHYTINASLNQQDLCGLRGGAKDLDSEEEPTRSQRTSRSRIGAECGFEWVREEEVGYAELWLSLVVVATVVLKADHRKKPGCLKYLVAS